MIIHHLVVDAVSWRILLEDLQAIYEALQAGEEPNLAPKTTSYLHWAKALEAHASAPEIEVQGEYWRDPKWHSVTPLVVDDPEGSNIEAMTDAVLVALEPEETRALLQEAPAAYRTEVEDLLLTALGLTLRDQTGSNCFAVAREGHGREALDDSLDLSRTVGWFTSLHPVLIDLGWGDELGDLIRNVKESLRRVPRGGLAYGLLHSKEGASSLPAEPQILFNYLGQLDHVLAESAPFRAAPEGAGRTESPEAHRSHFLELEGGVSEQRLQLSWRFSTGVFRPATVQAMADAFRRHLLEVVDHCLSTTTVGFTPSDFDLLEVDQSSLERLLLKHSMFDSDD
jgi:non-ribosomal peptide synthase protein (TIGR01720 family)